MEQEHPGRHTVTEMVERLSILFRRRFAVADAIGSTIRQTRFRRKTICALQGYASGANPTENTSKNFHAVMAASRSTFGRRFRHIVSSSRLDGGTDSAAR